MKFITTREKFLFGMKMLGKNLSRPSSLEILENVLINAVKDGIELRTTNLDLTLKVFIRAKVEQEGVSCMKLDLLSRLSEFFTSDSVSFSKERMDVKVTSGKVNTLFKGANPDEFPDLPKVHEYEVGTMDADRLRELITSVIFAAAVDDVRKEITGVFFHFLDDTLNLAATDSFKLAVKSCRYKDDFIDFQRPYLERSNPNFILPVKAAKELMRILEQVKSLNEEGEESKIVKILRSENQVFFILEDERMGIEILFGSKILDLEFPPYNAIIPKKYDMKLVMLKEIMLSSVKTVSVFSEREKNDVQMIVDAKKNSVRFYAESASLGKGETEISCAVEANVKTYDVFFNYHYLIEGCATLLSFPGENVVIELTQPETSTSPEGIPQREFHPVLFRSDKDDSFSYIVKPLSK